MTNRLSAVVSFDTGNIQGNLLIVQGNLFRCHPWGCTIFIWNRPMHESLDASTSVCESLQYLVYYFFNSIHCVYCIVFQNVYCYLFTDRSPCFHTILTPLFFQTCSYTNSPDLTCIVCLLVHNVHWLTKNITIILTMRKYTRLCNIEHNVLTVQRERKVI